MEINQWVKFKEHVVRIYVENGLATSYSITNPIAKIEKYVQAIDGVVYAYELYIPELDEIAFAYLFEVESISGSTDFLECLYGNPLRATSK